MLYQLSYCRDNMLMKNNRHALEKIGLSIRFLCKSNTFILYAPNSENLFFVSVGKKEVRKRKIEGYSPIFSSTRLSSDLETG